VTFVPRHHRRATAIPRTFSVATYNIHKCVGQDGAHQPARTFAVLMELDCDVVGIQEYDTRERPGRGPIDLKAFERATGYTAIACPTMADGHRFHGNVLLTRWPPRRIQTHDISVPGFQARKLLLSELAVGNRRVWVGVTHLGHGPGARKRQMQRLLDALPNSAERLVLLMDSNEWIPWIGAGRLARQRLRGGGVARSFPVQAPFLPLDRIWTDPGTILSNLRAHRTAVARETSDHLPVRAEFTLD
jgi:endonuclease/exonuclease/phosphatase family metal-dependent hydrolase